MMLTNKLAFIQLSSVSHTQVLADMTFLDNYGFMLDAVTLANFLGFLALVSYILTLLPTIFKVVFPNTKKTELLKKLFKYRRHIGVASFWFTLGHAYLLVLKTNFDFFDLETYLQYYTGITSFFIFTILTITSNDWSIKKLGAKSWKRLHQLTYLAMFLLLLHIWLIMSGDWSYLTPVGLLGMTVIIVLFAVRKWIERRDKQQKDKKNSRKISYQSKVSAYFHEHSCNKLRWILYLIY